MNIDMMRLVTDLDPAELSGSIAERGKDAGKETWANSKEAASVPVLTADQRDEAREFFKGFGAWGDEEIAAWSDVELDALVLQFAAGDLRELQGVCPGDGLGDIDWAEAEKCSHDGVVAGRLFIADIGEDAGKLFIYIGD